jgi:hypothetical protein
VKIIGISKLAFLAMLIGVLAAAPRAISDDISPDLSDSAPVADSSDANQVLEIPQLCDSGSIGDPCDSAASSDDGALSSSDSSPASDVNPGSLDDYANQGVDVEAASGGPIYIPVPEAVAPNHAYYSPSPVVVSSRPMGPGFYQSAVPGPGAYQSWTRGPGSYSPMMSGGGFGPRSFGGGAFRHR